MEEKITGPKKWYSNYCLLDVAIKSLTKLFKSNDKHCDIFRCLHISDIKNMDSETVEEHCSDLHIATKDADAFDRLKLNEDLTDFALLLSPSDMMWPNTLTYIYSKDLASIFSNVTVKYALKAFWHWRSQLPVGCEVFRAKTEKENCLHMMMSQERWADLAIISIEPDI